MSYLWVAIGGAFGSVARFWISGLVAERVAQGFPWHTLVVNVSGSLVIGFLAAATALEKNPGNSPILREFLMVGVCGGYTTFSAFSLQTLELCRDREWLSAGGNVVLSVVLCLVAVWLGYLIGSALFAAKAH